MRNYRWIVISGLCLIGFLAYIDRVNLSMSAVLIMKEFNLSGAEMGLILGAMFPGYLLFNIIGGALLDRFKPTKLFMYAIAIWSLSTAWFTQISSFVWFYIARFIFGAAEGLMPPYNAKIVSNWMLPKERGRANSFWIGATMIGVAVGAPVSGLIIKAYDWRTLFYIFTIFGFIVIGVLYFIVKDYPRLHPNISPDELKLIDDTLKDEAEKKMYVPGDIATSFEIKQLLRDPYLWLIAIGYLTAITMWWANLSWLPGYLVKEKGFTVLKSGYWSSFPFLLGAAGLVFGGFLTDKLFKGQRVTLIIIFQFLAPPTVFLAIGSSDNIIMVMAFAVSMFFTCGAVGQWWPLPMELFNRKLAATASGIMSGVGTIGAIIAPVLLGYLFDVTKSFYWGFGVIAIITFAGALLSFFILAHERRIHNKLLGVGAAK